GCRLIAHPVAASRRKQHEVSRGKCDLAGLTVYLKPAAARRDDMEGGVAVRLDAEAPRCGQQRAAIDRAADPDLPQELADLISRIEVAQQFYGGFTSCARNQSSPRGGIPGVSQTRWARLLRWGC